MNEDAVPGFGNPSSTIASGGWDGCVAFFETSLDLLGVSAAGDGRWSRVNAAMCRALGWSEDELRAMAPLDLAHPDDKERVAAEILASTTVAGLEHRVRCKDGSYLRVRWNVVRDPARSVSYHSGRDITARRQAEDLLGAQSLALAAVAAPIPLKDALSVLTQIVEHQSGETSIAAIMLLDLETSTLGSGVGASLPAWYHAELEGVKAALGIGTCATAAACNQRVVTEDIAAAPSWLGLAHLPLSLGLKAAWSMPIRSSEGCVLGTFGTYFRECRGPTEFERQLVEGLSHVAGWALERERAADALRRSEERLRNAMEAGEVQTWRIDLPGGTDSAGARAEFLAGVYPDARPRAEAAWRAAIEHGDDYEVELPVISAAGAAGWVRDRGRVVRDTDGQPSYFTGASVDITERVHSELRLREQELQKDQFLAVLGHELRTPLAPLRTGLDVLQSGVSEEASARVRAIMSRQIDHLVRLVDDLLDLSRVSRGTVALRRARLDLDHVMDLAVELTKPVIDERGHELIVRRWHAPLTVYGDRERLTQVIANLLTNAAKYMDRNGTIRLSTAIEGECAVLRVADDGYGIPAAAFPALFQMFGQVPEHREITGGGGLGIGLAISRQLIELHGGTIEAASAGLGCGSEFMFRVPLAERKSAAAEPEAVAIAPVPPRRVLVVDDNADAADALRLLLEQEGLTVRTAQDGPAALHALDHFAAEVVLLDIGLPGIDGYEVARRIRRTPSGRDMLLCALTGWGQEGDKRRARAAGFDMHLTKPVKLAQILALFGEAIDAGHSRN